MESIGTYNVVPSNELAKEIAKRYLEDDIAETKTEDFKRV